MGTNNSFDLSASVSGDDVVSKYVYSGRRVVVECQKSGGIGFETARILFESGSHVLMISSDAKDLAGRKEKYDKSREKKKSDGSMEICHFNTKSFESIGESAEILKREFEDMFVDALLFTTDFFHEDLAVTENLESMMYENFYSKFLTTLLLLPIMNKKGSRIIHLSNTCYKNAQTDLISFMKRDGVWKNREFDPWKAYSDSKLCTLLASKAFDRRLKMIKAYEKIDCFSVFPGLVKYETTTKKHVRTLSYFSGEYWGGYKSVEQAASTLLFAIMEPRLKGRGGSFLVDCDIYQKLDEGMVNLHRAKKVLNIMLEKLGVPFDNLAKGNKQEPIAIKVENATKVTLTVPEEVEGEESEESEDGDEKIVEFQRRKKKKKKGKHKRMKTPMLMKEKYARVLREELESKEDMMERITALKDENLKLEEKCKKLNAERKRLVIRCSKYESSIEEKDEIISKLRGEGAK